MSETGNHPSDHSEPIQDGGKSSGPDFDPIKLMSEARPTSSGDRVSDASLGLPNFGVNSDVSTGLLAKDSSGALQLQAADLGKMISFGGAFKSICDSCPKTS